MDDGPPKRQTEWITVVSRGVARRRKLRSRRRKLCITRGSGS